MGKSATHLLTKGASSAKLGATKEAANPNSNPNPAPDPNPNPNTGGAVVGSTVGP